MRILAIETSCDETAVSLLEATGPVEHPRFRILGNALYSQAKKHAQYGGVFPSLAKREHGANLVPLLLRALTEAGLLEKAQDALTHDEAEHVAKILTREDVLGSGLIEFLRFHKRVQVDAIAVTQGPGLEPALWVGVNFAVALAHVWKCPIIPVNHLEGHIVSALVEPLPEQKHEYELPPVLLPVMALLVSGGHTELVHMTTWGAYTIVGRTRDDAAGEAFDKVARLLDLPYPGGPELAALAKHARRNAHVVVPGVQHTKVTLPRPMLQSPNLDFSFSGLKTAVLYEVRKLGELSKAQKGEIAREFEDAVRDVLVAKTRRALEQYPARTLVAGGGVSANAHLRSALARMFEELQPHDVFHVPEPSLTGDNAVMIGMAAYLRHLHHIVDEVTDDLPLRADGSMRLG